MLPFQGDSAAASKSCSSSSYIELRSVADCMSLKRLTAHRSRADRLTIHDNYILWRDRQLLEKLVRNEALYNAVRNLLLSESNSSFVRKPVVEDLLGAGNSDMSAMIDLVDKGAVLGPRKLSECCSCCSSKGRLREQIKKRRTRRRLHGDGFIVSNTVTGSNRAVANNFLCEAKHVKSEPCTCTRKLSIVILRGSKRHLQYNLYSPIDEHKRKNTEISSNDKMQPYVCNYSISQRVSYNLFKPQHRLKRNVTIKSKDELPEKIHIVSKYNQIFNSFDNTASEKSNLGDRCAMLNSTPNDDCLNLNKRLYLCETNSEIALKDSAVYRLDEHYKLEINKLANRFPKDMIDLFSTEMLEDVEKSDINYTLKTQVNRDSGIQAATVADYTGNMTTRKLSIATSISQNMLHNNANQEGVVTTRVLPYEDKHILKTTGVQTSAKCSCFEELTPILKFQISKTCQCNSLEKVKTKRANIFKCLHCKYQHKTDNVTKMRPDCNIYKIGLRHDNKCNYRHINNLDIEEDKLDTLPVMTCHDHILKTAVHCKCADDEKNYLGTNSHNVCQNSPIHPKANRKWTRKVYFDSNLETSNCKKMGNELNVPLTKTCLKQNFTNNEISVQYDNTPIPSHILPTSQINTEQSIIHDKKEVSSHCDFAEPTREFKNTLKIQNTSLRDTNFLNGVNKFVGITQKSVTRPLVTEIMKPTGDKNVVIVIQIGQNEKCRDMAQPVKPRFCTLNLQKLARGSKKYNGDNITKQPDVKKLSKVLHKNDIISEVKIETLCRKKQMTSVSCGMLKNITSFKSLQTKPILREKKTETKYSKRTRTAQSKVKMCNKFVGMNLKLKRCFCNLKFLNEGHSNRYNFKLCNPFKYSHPMQLYYMKKNHYNRSTLCKNIDEITSLPHLPSHLVPNSHNALKNINNKTIGNKHLCNLVSVSSVEYKSVNKKTFFEQHQLMNLLTDINHLTKSTKLPSRRLGFKSQVNFDVRYLHTQYNFHESNCFASYNNIKYSEFNSTIIDKRLKPMERNISPLCVSGIGPYLKRCYCTMNIQISGRRNKLKPYECEPGVCIPYECDPVECQKLIKKRLKRKVNAGSGTHLKRKSNSSATLSSEMKSRMLQSGPRRNDRQLLEYPPQRNFGSPLAHKQAVRLGSSFNFNIEFSKESFDQNERTYSPYTPERRQYKTKGTTGISNNSYDMDSQSDPKKFRHRGSTARMKRCFCTLKLQKTGRGHKSKVNPDQILKNRSTSTFTNNYYDSMSRETSQNTKKHKKKRKLLPYECEPGVCIPGECNPYECLELINKRQKKSRGTSSTKSDVSSGTGMLDKQRRRKAIQSQPYYRGGPSENLGDETSVKPSRQAVRIGSSFSFNVEFFKENGSRGYSRDGDPSRITYEERTPIRGQRYSKRNTYSQDSRPMHHTYSQMSVPERANYTMTSPFLKRCFCTLKLLSKKQKKLKKEKILKKPKKEKKKRVKPVTHVTQTSKRHTVAVLEPYECEPGVCIPGLCDPYKCLKRIKKRHNSTTPNRKRVRTKSISSSVDTKNTRAGIAQANKNYTPIAQSNRMPMSYENNQQYSPQRQAVRIGSTFSFDIEFYKDMCPDTGQTTEEVEKYQPNKYGTRNTEGQTTYKSRPYNRGSQANIRYQRQKGSGSGPLLKRCFCTLELQNANKKGRVYVNRNTDTGSIRNIPTLRDRSVMAKKRHLLPYECEPNVCVPGSCDPYECEKRIKRRLLNQARGTSTYGRPSRSVSSTALTYRNYQSQFAGVPPRRQREDELTEAPVSGPPRQGVRIGSTFSFNIEFYKDSSPGDFNGSSTPAEQFSRHTSQLRKNTRDTNSQSRLRKQRNAGATPFLKRCFCTLQLRKGKNKKGSAKKKLVKNKCQCKNVGVGIRKSGKPNIVALERGINTKKYPVQFVHLEPYECEPGVCVPGECDPHKCLKRIKARKVRSCCTKTQKCCVPASTCCTPVTKAQINQARQPPLKRYRSDSLLGYELPVETPSRQAVRLGSSFSFNAEFFKDAHNPQTSTSEQDYQQYPRRHRNVSTYGDNGKRHHVSLQSQGAKLESRASGSGRILKRCMCTLKLQKRGHQKSDPKRKVKHITPMGNRHQIVAMVARELGYEANKMPMWPYAPDFHKSKCNSYIFLKDATQTSHSATTQIVKPKKVKKQITIPQPSTLPDPVFRFLDGRQEICFRSNSSFNIENYKNETLPGAESTIKHSETRKRLAGWQFGNCNDKNIESAEKKTTSKGSCMGPMKRCLCTLTLQSALVHYTNKNELKNILENKIFYKTIQKHVPNYTISVKYQPKMSVSEIIYLNKHFCTNNKTIVDDSESPVLHGRLAKCQTEESTFSQIHGNNRKQRTNLHSPFSNNKVINNDITNKKVPCNVDRERVCYHGRSKKRNDVFTLRNLLSSCFNLSKSYNIQDELRGPKTATCCQEHITKPIIALLKIDPKLYRSQNAKSVNMHYRDKIPMHLEERDGFEIQSKMETIMPYNPSKFDNMDGMCNDKTSINNYEHSRQNVTLTAASKEFSNRLNYAIVNKVPNNLKNNTIPNDLKNKEKQKPAFFKRLMLRCFQVFSKRHKTAISHKNTTNENVDRQKGDILKPLKSGRHSRVIKVNMPKKKSTNFKTSIVLEKTAIEDERKGFSKFPVGGIVEIQATSLHNKTYQHGTYDKLHNSERKKKVISDKLQCLCNENMKPSDENKKQSKNESYLRVCNCQAVADINKSISKPCTVSHRLPVEFSKSRNGTHSHKTYDRGSPFGHQQYDVFFTFKSKKKVPLKMIKTCQCLGVCRCPKINEKAKSCGTVGKCTCCICKKKIKHKPKPVKNLCTCGNPFCNKEFKRIIIEKAKASSIPPPQVKPCICGSRICRQETRKLKALNKRMTKGEVICSCPKHLGHTCECSLHLGETKKKREEERIQARREEDLNKKKELNYEKQQKHKLRLIALRDKKKKIEKKRRAIRRKKAYKRRMKRYAQEDTVRAKQRKAYDKQMLKNLERYRNSGSASLIIESILDIAKLGVVSAADIIRFATKTVREPKDSLMALGRNIAEPDRAFTKLQHVADHSPGISTLKRVRWRLSHAAIFKTGKYLLESHPVTDFLLHPTDVRGREARRRFRRKRPRLDFQCSPFMLSLRKMPCVNIYLLCPWFYPHCMSLVQFWRNFTDVMLFILAIGVWCPCLLAMEACRAITFCCFCAR